MIDGTIDGVLANIVLDLHCTWCINRQTERMSGDLAIFEGPGDVRTAQMVTSDIDDLHVINGIIAGTATCLRTCEWHHPARRSPPVASIGRNKDMSASKDHASTGYGANHVSRLSVLLISFGFGLFSLGLCAAMKEARRFVHMMSFVERLLT
jgi:hypothetical protein